MHNDYGTLWVGNPGKNTPEDAQRAVDTAEVLRLLPLVRVKLLKEIEQSPQHASAFLVTLRKLAWE